MKQAFGSNNQYARRECLEITRFSENIENKKRKQPGEDFSYEK